MIDNMMLITLFDSLYPCWTEEMLAREGVDLSALDRLVKEGLIRQEAGVYSLSDAGVAEFKHLALENFIEMCIRDRSATASYLRRPSSPRSE